jgi:hypothetical protein
MARRYPHAAQARDERAHGVIQDAIDKGFLDTGKKYYVGNLPGHEVANEARRAITRGLHHFNLAPTAWVTDTAGEPCWKDCKDPDAAHGAGFELHSKNAARKYIVDSTGGDPSKLKYNPFAPPPQPRFSDDGTWIPGKLGATLTATPGRLPR